MAKKPDGSTKFTELRRVQMELEEARDRYVDLYDGAPTGYLTLNPKGMILEANLPACTLLGINRKDLLGKPVVGFVAADAFAAGDFKVCRPRIDLLAIVTLHDVALAAFSMGLPFALGR